MSRSGTALVGAERERVWEILCDVEGWPDWNPACVSANLDGPLEPGARLDLVMRHPTGRTFITRPSISEVDHANALEWSAKGMGFRARTRVTLQDGPHGTTVRMAADTEGPMAFTYRMIMPPDIQEQMLKTTLGGLSEAT